MESIDIELTNNVDITDDECKQIESQVVYDTSFAMLAFLLPRLLACSNEPNLDTGNVA